MNDTEEVGQDEIKTAKFVKGYGNIKSQIKMIFGVSMGNEKQTGNDLISFVNLINSHTHKITDVEIMVADYLHRHYSTEEEAQAAGDEWLRDNAEILKQLKVPYKIVRWKDILAEPEFQQAQIKIKEHYEKDSGFKAKVQNVAKSHIDKGDITNVEKYLLEECAYFIYKTGYLTYPADKLNSACMHLIQKYNNDLLFFPYRLDKRKKSDEFNPSMQLQQQQITQQNSNTSTVNSYLSYVSVSRVQPSYCYPEELMVGCSKLALLMGKHGITKIEQREQFFSQYLKSMQPCMSMVPTLVCGESSTEIERRDNYVQGHRPKGVGVNN